METHTHPAFDPDHPAPADTPPEAPAGHPAPINTANIYPETPATPIAPLQTSAPAPAMEKQGMFGGRLGRMGYFLVSVIATVYFFVPVTILIIIASMGNQESFRVVGNIVSLLLGLFGVCLLIPVAIGASIRRWHDLNKSGWYILLGFIPFVSILVSLYMLFAPGTPGPNVYGEPDNRPNSLKKVLFGK